MCYFLHFSTLYNKKTRKLTECPIRDYKNIYIINNNLKCGDVVFSKYPNTEGKNDENRNQSQPIIIGNQTDIIIFEAVEQPDEIQKIAIELRNKLNN